VKWIWDPHCNVYVYQVHWAALGACTACRIDNRSSLFVHNSFVLIGLLLIFVLSLHMKCDIGYQEIVCQCYAALT
jgi:hypothetical protein